MYLFSLKIQFYYKYFILIVGIVVYSMIFEQGLITLFLIASRKMKHF